VREHAGAQLSTWEAERERRRAFRSRFPGQTALAAGLRRVLGADIELLDREPNLYRSTYPSEIVTVRRSGGRPLVVLCKYGRTDVYTAFGHRGGPSYEALVYARVLAPLGLRPRYHGHAEAAAGETWLVTEFVEDADRLDCVEPSERPLLLVAEWLARFHAAGERLLPALEFLNVYDRAYYAGWAERTIVFARPLRARFPWLERLCREFVGDALPVLAASRTVVHGECTAHNVVFRAGEVFPIDWESAAAGAGEIDLAAAAEGWPAGAVAEAEDAYCRLRWPAGAPAGFDARLSAARMYWALRWLGEREDWTLGPKNEVRLERLRELAGELGLA
jgi:Phosphotransferase enzyme family